MTQTTVNRIVFFVIAVSLLPGYPRASISGKVINVQAWGSVLLLSVLGGYFFARQKQSLSIVYLSIVFACYSLIGYVRIGDVNPVIAHAFIFAPFIIAYLLLELRVGHNFGEVMLYLTICAAIGAIAANVIQWYYPDTLASLLKGEQNLDYIISTGRVSWAGYVTTLPLVAQLGFLSIYSKKQRFTVLVCLPVIIAGALLTFSRTLLFALLILLVYFLVSIQRRITFKGIALIGAVGLGGAYFVTWWGAVNPSLRDLIDYRILAFFTGTSATTADVAIRSGMYSEYWYRLTHSYFLGQGLGVPVSTFLGSSDWSDVTLVSFAIPFGIFGLMLFFTFIRRVHARIGTQISNNRVRKLFMVVFWLALGVSLNDDIWSHKYFPVYFVFILNSYIFWLSAKHSRIKPVSQQL